MNASHPNITTRSTGFMDGWDNRLSSSRILHCIVVWGGLSLRVAFLIGRNYAATCATNARVCAVPGIQTAVVLLYTAHSAPSQRWRKLKRNIRPEGVSYSFYRELSALRLQLEKFADEVIPNEEVEQLLDAAFP